MAGCREPAGQERKPQVENCGNRSGGTAVRQRRVQRGQPLAGDRHAAADRHAADAERADVFQIPQGSPLLYIDELGYNFVGQPILYSQEYYANGIFKHTILRKKI